MYTTGLYYILASEERPELAYTKRFLKRHAEPIERKLHLSDITNQPKVLDCPDEVLAKINKDLDLKNDLGIYPGEEGKIPESAGIPRIFVMEPTIISPGAIASRRLYSGQ